MAVLVRVGILLPYNNGSKNALAERDSIFMISASYARLLSLTQLRVLSRNVAPREVNTSFGLNNPPPPSIMTAAVGRSFSLYNEAKRL
jgi:hypothetical protein